MPSSARTPPKRSDTLLTSSSTEGEAMPCDSVR
jgi:hypothetical protein